jgi:hypothetical protein
MKISLNNHYCEYVLIESASGSYQICRGCGKVVLVFN